MKRSFQEIVELGIFGVIALTLATLVLWLGGHILRIVGIVASKLAGWIWLPVRYLFVIAIIVIAIYFIIKFLQRDKDVPAKAATIITTPPKAEDSKPQ
ncbi:MAG: hypothetical protein R2880_04890 [Deinococcales bacterium]